MVACFIGTGWFLKEAADSIKTDELTESYVTGYNFGYDQGTADRQKAMNDLITNSLEEYNQLRIRLDGGDGQVNEITLIPEAICNILNETTSTTTE